MTENPPKPAAPATRAASARRWASVGGFHGVIGTLQTSTLARWFAVVVLSGLGWRLARFFLNLDMTGDEANVLRDVWARTYLQLLQPLNYAQVLPPGFLWITKIFDSLFRNEWGVRLLPELAGLAALVLFWMLCREVLRGAARWVAWGIFSVSYVPVAEAACVKGYTIDLLVAMLMFWWMLRWLGRGQNARELLWLGLCAPIFIWVSYTSVFVIGAVGAVFVGYCLANRAVVNRSSLWAGALFMATTGVSAGLLYLINIRPALAMSKAVGLQDFWGQGYPPLSQPWKIPLWLVEVHCGRGFAWPVGDNHYRSAGTAALWLTGLIAYWRRGHRWAWALFVGANVLSLAAAFLHKYPYGANPRICMFLGPGVCLFMGEGAQRLLRPLKHNPKHLCYKIAACALAAIALVGTTRDIVLRIREFKGPDIRRTMVAANRAAGPDGQFIILPGNPSGIMDYYVKRYISQPVSLWAKFDFTQARPGSNVGVMTTATLRKTGAGTVDTAPFARFERSFGKPPHLLWEQTAVVQPPDKEPGVIVRVYRVGD